MPTYEGLRLKLLKFNRMIYADARRSHLNKTDFTIISNNCWGGMIYESYNLPKKSPTVGMFFMAPDYIQFLMDLKGYLYGTLSFIKPEVSKWKKARQVSGDKRFGTYPVGVLSNGKKEIELFFLHYRSEEEAREKWKRRCGRINWDRMIVKFNDQNECTEKEVCQFMNLPIRNKLFFTCKKWSESVGEDAIVIRQFPAADSIRASYEPFGKSKYIDMTKYINNMS